jgi:membrane protease YdiL (CAAX protease family)
MTSPTEPRTLRLYHGGLAFEPVFASALVAMSVATFYLFSGVVPQAFALVGGQAVLVAGPVIAAFALRANHRVLGVRLPRKRFVTAAILIGLTAWYLNMRLVMALDPPTEQLHKLEQLVDTAPLAEALIMLAVLPPLCEEILFRGVLARALGRHLRLVAAAAISAVLFAAYHHSLVQGLPTLTLGFVLAVIAIRADSVAPTIIAHAINNAMAITMSRDELPAIAGWLGRHPTLALAGCAGATAVGIAIAARGPA